MYYTWFFSLQVLIDHRAAPAWRAAAQWSCDETPASSQNRKHLRNSARRPMSRCLVQRITRLRTSSL